MLRTILVPLDGSRFGEHALPLAITLARKSKARIHLVHSHQRLDSPYAEMMVFDSTLDDQVRGHELAYLDATVKRIKQNYAGQVTYTIEEGHTVTVIGHQAAETHADVIVLTTHARGPLARFWLGSVTDELIRTSEAPLFLTHPLDGEADFSKDVPLGRWLVPLDGTEHAEHILPDVFKVADLFQPAFTFLRVLRPVTPMMIPAAVGGFAPLAEDVILRVETIQKDVEKDATAYLDRMAAPLRAKGQTVHTTVAVDEYPGEAILNRARHDIDVVSLATHGRHGLSRMLLGSIAENVIRGCAVPVLVHRHNG
jgi:nucleotide-binding universal stress UspA family protein